MSSVLVEKPRPHTAVITLNRPERMNSMAFEGMLPLKQAFEQVGADNGIWTVVLTGRGRGFCSGADTQATEPPPGIEGLTLTRIATRAMSILAEVAVMERLLSGVPVEEKERSPGEHARWLLAHLADYHWREKKVNRRTICSSLPESGSDSR